MTVARVDLETGEILDPLTPRERGLRVRDDLADAAASFVSAGQHLIEDKAAVAHGEFSEVVATAGISHAWANHLMSIARHPVLANSYHGRNLPASVRTLAELARAPEAAVEAAIADGTITPELERSQAREWVATVTEPRRPRPQRGDQISDSSGETRTVTDIEETGDGELIVHDEDGDCLIVPDDDFDEEADEEDDTEPRQSKAPTKPDLDGTGLSHPARYSDALLPVFAAWLPVDIYPRVLDPFAGTGKIHELPNDTVGVEIEPEWANLHPDTVVGDALHLSFEDATFDAVCTSPTYGNRLADSHNASDPERRRSYTHDLGRPLSESNSGSLHWGVDYQIFHEQAWEEAFRVLRPGGRFVVNVKDHIRGGELQLVSHWHVATLVDLGLTYVGGVAIPARSLKAGANADERTGHELVLIFDLTAGGPR